MEIMYKNNMIYIRKQISVCIWKTRSTPTLFPFITVKWIIPNVYMKDQKKKWRKNAPTMLATRYNKNLYNKVLDNNEQHSLPH